MNNIGDQLNQVINNLSDKLGVTANKLYPMLIKQAYINGIKSLILAAIAMVIAICLLIIIIKWIKHPILDSQNDWDGSQFARVFFLGVVILISTLVFICNTNTSINALLNPEYYTIQNIINQISNQN